jgi:hypothetical protein
VIFRKWSEGPIAWTWFGSNVTSYFFTYFRECRYSNLGSGIFPPPNAGPCTDINCNKCNSPECSLWFCAFFNWFRSGYRGNLHSTRCVSIRTEQTSFGHWLLLPVFALGFHHSLCTLFGFVRSRHFFLCWRVSGCERAARDTGSE